MLEKANGKGGVGGGFTTDARRKFMEYPRQCCEARIGVQWGAIDGLLGQEHDEIGAFQNVLKLSESTQHEENGGGRGESADHLRNLGQGLLPHISIPAYFQTSGW